MVHSPVGRAPVPATGSDTPPLRARDRGGQSRTELAVKRIVGLLGLATGVGLLAPLVLAIQRDEADGVGAIVVAVISAVTIVAGLVLVFSGRGSGGDGGGASRPD
jgi:hypothetical protein